MEFPRTAIYFLFVHCVLNIFYMSKIDSKPRPNVPRGTKSAQLRTTVPGRQSAPWRPLGGSHILQATCCRVLAWQAWVGFPAHFHCLSSDLGACRWGSHCPLALLPGWRGRRGPSAECHGGAHTQPLQSAGTELKSHL